MNARAPSGPTQEEIVRSIGLFVLTLVCVFWAYVRSHGGTLATAGAWSGVQFACGLMTILLAHEMGHYLVARRHGFELSLPYFIPFPFFLGTFGAIIRLRSPPRTRTALLEMGAAGPLCGFAVAVTLMVIGLPLDVPQTLDQVVDAAFSQVAVAGPEHALPAFVERALIAIGRVLEWISPTPPNTFPLGIYHDPPVMDLVSWLSLGQIPGRYDTFSPLAEAGWFGCLLTAINLLPIGQLDGGHIMNALAPRWAPRIVRPLIGLAFLAGVLVYPGWLLWAVLIVALGAWTSLPVPHEPGLTPRARFVALLAALTFALSFMPEPIEIENVPFPDGMQAGPAEDAPPIGNPL
jgi:membrane-associated protease RseP (regulator of RpoE activity)